MFINITTCFTFAFILKYGVKQNFNILKHFKTITFQNTRRRFKWVKWSQVYLTSQKNFVTQFKINIIKPRNKRIGEEGVTVLTEEDGKDWMQLFMKK